MMFFLRWTLTTAGLAVLTILAHELAHYFAAIVMGAEDVRLHWADITFSDGSLSNTGLAVTWLAGPLITHLFILWMVLSGTTHPVSLALGLAACSRNLVLLPFTIKLLLGRDISTFSNDEVTAAKALDLSPVPFALFAVGLAVVGLVIGLARANRTHRLVLQGALLVGTVLGIVLWGLVGPVVLPGGKGFD